jgi:hypothetical protein
MVNPDGTSIVIMAVPAATINRAFESVGSSLVMSGRSRAESRTTNSDRRYHGLVNVRLWTGYTNMLASKSGVCTSWEKAKTLALRAGFDVASLVSPVE